MKIIVSPIGPKGRFARSSPSWRFGNRANAIQVCGMGGKRSLDLPATPALRVSPKVADNIFSPGLDADFRRAKKECLVHRIRIENGDCARAISQRFHDCLEAILLAHRSEEHTSELQS